MKSITSVIISHFDKYSLQSAKKINYDLWKQCINLKIKEKRLTLQTLEQIIAIKRVINLGLSDNLKIALSHIKSIIRPEYVVNEGKLDPYWVSGFTAECFTSSISANGIRISYAIGLHKREGQILSKIMEFFGSKGNIGSYGEKTSVEYRISVKSDLIIFVIPHFENYQMSGVKQHNYLI